MVKRKFGKTGPYIYQGKQIDMYKLSIWIGKYNRKNKTALRPSTVKEKHIKLFLKAIEKEKRDTALPANIDAGNIEDWL